MSDEESEEDMSEADMFWNPLSDGEEVSFEGGHIDFRSVDSDLLTAFNLYAHFHGILEEQESFEFLCPPWETSEWDDQELNLFVIDIDAIDRVYYYTVGLAYDSCTMALYGRIDTTERFLYFHLYVLLDIEDHVVKGKVYLTYDAKVFLKSIIGAVEGCNFKGICKIMVRDGLLDEKDTRFHENDDDDVLQCGEEPPTLLFLCHKAVYENQKLLKPIAECIPGVAKSVKQFIKLRKFQETCNHHQKCMQDLINGDEMNDADLLL